MFDKAPEEWLGIYRDILGPEARPMGGRWLAAWRCPFHPDRNPSFTVDRKGFWRCWAGCGHGGYLDILRRLGLPLPDMPDGQTAVRPVRKPARQHAPPLPWRALEPDLGRERSLVRIMDRARRNPARFDRWAERGLDRETVERYGLGLGYLTVARGIRLLVPCYEGGRLIAVKGRALPGGPEPRWVTQSAVTGQGGLWNADGVLKRAKGRVVLVAEGPVDGILAEVNRSDVVAVAPVNGCGSDHERIASLMAAVANVALGVIVAFDNDLAGVPNGRAQYEGLMRMARKRDRTDMVAWLEETAPRPDLLDAYLETAPDRGWPVIAMPSGVKLANLLTRRLAGKLPVTVIQWPEDRPYGHDLADEFTGKGER